MTYYLEAMWPASPGFAPQLWFEAPVVKGDRIMTGSLGPRVRCIKRVHMECEKWTFAELADWYGTKGRNAAGDEG